MNPERADRAAAVFPIVVLLCIAFTQIYLATFQGLSPWKGGGFGMFSTVDSPGARFIRASVLRDGQPDVPFRLPEELKSVASQIRVLPNEVALSGIAQHLADGVWYRSISMPTDAPHTPTGSDMPSLDDVPLHGSQLRVVGPKAKDIPNVFDIDGVKLELLRYVFDSDAKQMKVKTIMVATARKGGT